MLVFLREIGCDCRVALALFAQARESETVGNVTGEALSGEPKRKDRTECGLQTVEKVHLLGWTFCALCGKLKWGDEND